MMVAIPGELRRYAAAYKQHGEPSGMKIRRIFFGSSSSFSGINSAFQIFGI